MTIEYGSRGYTFLGETYSTRPEMRYRLWEQFVASSVAEAVAGDDRSYAEQMDAHLRASGFDAGLSEEERVDLVEQLVEHIEEELA